MTSQKDMPNKGSWFGLLQNLQSLMLIALVGGGSWFGSEVWQQIQRSQRMLMDNRVIMVEIREEHKRIIADSGRQEKQIDMLDTNQRNVMRRLDALENKRPAPAQPKSSP